MELRLDEGQKVFTSFFQFLIKILLKFTMEHFSIEGGKEHLKTIWKEYTSK